METRHEACSAEGQPRNILEHNPNRFAARCPHRHATVIPLSTVVMRFCLLFTAPRAVATMFDAQVLCRPPARVNDVPSQARAIPPDQRRAPFMNSKPKHRLLLRSESPLSDTAALWQEIRDVHEQVRREPGGQGDTR